MMATQHCLCRCRCWCCTRQDLDFSTVLAPKAEALFDELSDVLAPYYMGANSPLSAEDQQVNTRQTSLPVCNPHNIPSRADLSESIHFLDCLHRNFD